MNQQRSRRFRSAKEAKEKDEDKAELLKMLKSQKGSEFEEGFEEKVTKKTWDSNSITPGTPFMFMLAACLRYWCAYKINTDPGWENMKVIISDASVPGEGEHKIMEFVRSQRSDPQHDPNTRHVIYGLDADLIMLGLATHEAHFHVLREDVFFQEAKARTCTICGQKGHFADQCKGEAKKKEGEFDEKDKNVGLKPFIWLHVSILREYLAAELEIPNLPFRFDLERALDDWVFMCFFVGNDFLPHLPSLDIKENGIDTLIAIWRDNLPVMGGYLTKDGQVDLRRAQFILNGLAKQEDAIFRKRREIEVKRENNYKRRKLEEENRNRNKNGRKSDFNSNKDAPPMDMSAPDSGRQSTTALTHDMVVNSRTSAQQTNQANKSAAAELKNRLMQKSSNSEAEPNGNANNDAQTPVPPISVLGKRKAEMIEDEPSTPGRSTPDSTETPKPIDPEPAPDTVRLWEDGYADRYYEQKFHADPKDIAFRNKVAQCYVEGLAWVLLYYFQGCPSWTWYYPYHYAPFAADFVELDKMEIKFEKGKPFHPYEQLMGVLPAASNHAIPEVFRNLMSEEDSEILDFYPEDFEVDLNGKKWAWQGVALLPFIDSNRLLDAMAKKYPLLSPEEAERNKFGKDVLIFSDRHPLYDAVTSNFYSKRQGASKLKLDMNISRGLAGKVEKNPEYLPQSQLAFPLNGDAMPTLDQDHSLR
jgi:5'-3' exoribonuclease 2